MFTGIVEEIGEVVAVRAEPPASLEIACREAVADAAVGDSISVAGCCVTVTELASSGAGRRSGFTADLMGETLARTSLGQRRPGDRVNLERPLRAGAPLGGHLVQGHVDAACEIVAVEPHGEWTTVWCELPAHLAPYVVEKGSVAVEGASLTVADVGEGRFSVGLIPHTQKATTLGGLRPGDRVNLEVDVVAKYVERLLAGGAATPYDPDRGLQPPRGREPE
jgi:riboflavin synthase